MAKIITELEKRAEEHDDSKLMPDEFAGFTRINSAAREYPYGSEPYIDGLRREKPTIDLHYSRNSHHPEHHGSVLESRVCIGAEVAAEDMNFFDIIEMVCDWYAAFIAYGSQGTWKENVAYQKERFRDWLKDEQWWLVDSVSRFIYENKS